jgi:hypothetical protein
LIAHLIRERGEADIDDDDDDDDEGGEDGQLIRFLIGARAVRRRRRVRGVALAKFARARAEDDDDDDDDDGDEDHQLARFLIGRNVGRRRRLRRMVLARALREGADA